MSNRSAGFFEFFSRQAGCYAHLQSRRDNLFRLEVVLKSFEASNEDTVRKALF